MFRVSNEVTTQKDAGALLVLYSLAPVTHALYMISQSMQSSSVSLSLFFPLMNIQAFIYVH